MDEEVSAIVIQNGEANIKAGFAGEEAPRSVFPTIVAMPKINALGAEIFVGNDA